MLVLIIIAKSLSVYIHTLYCFFSAPQTLYLTTLCNSSMSVYLKFPCLLSGNYVQIKILDIMPLNQGDK